MSRTPLRWDIFCRVVDNYGDAAVCWRLARQLSVEHGATVRLLIDRPETLARLQPGPSAVSVLHWRSDSDFGEPAQVAIDAFDSGLPDAYAARMTPQSLWIKLEYLSAEPWVDEHHGLPSPHPTLAVRRYFYFPGFTERTGGLLHEAGLTARREAFEPASFWNSLDFAPPAADATVISLFGYENAAACDLLQAWSDGARPVVLAITECPLRADVREFLGGESRRGNLHARYVPFLAQSRYDELLWACHWNFVRGEDSFVRAQWAAKPFVWQAYPQKENAHRAKLDACIDRYCRGLDAPVGELWRAWNGYGGQVGAAWNAVDAMRPQLQAHARAWEAHLAAQENLASRLARFCENRL